jgi:DNA-binding transcriptional ArsR family regulator
MPDSEEDRTDAVFHALSDRTRRDILRRLLAGERSVSALAPKYEMSLTAVQKHVAVLERAGLVTKRRQGREALAQGDVQAVRSAARLLRDLEDLWRGRISRIDDLVAGTEKEDDHAGHRHHH